MVSNQIPTFSLQKTLPRLPVPSLQETCSLYLRSVAPLQTKEEHDKTKAIVHDFMTGPLGRSLQERLIDIDHHSPFNWLDDNFWLKKAYLEWRAPLMVNSNWYMLGKDDDHHPQELLANNGQSIPAGQFSQFQIRRAAHMIYYALDYNDILERQDLPVDLGAGKKPLCMHQYTKIYGITRIPLPYCDALVETDPASILHIIVLVRDQIYKLQVYQIVDGIKHRLSVDQIQSELSTIVSHAVNLKQPQKPISLLTSWDRDNWALARNHLLTLDPNNRSSLTKIETGLMALCLDDYSLGADVASWARTSFCGQHNLGVGHNRWYDKSFTLFVENNGKASFVGEHSPCDALMLSYVVDHTLAHSVTTHSSSSSSWMSADLALFNDQPFELTTRSSHAEHLTWTTDHHIDTYLLQAQEDANTTANLSDPYVLQFHDYGTDWVKRVAKMAPDAYFQMILQLAYYRAHHKITATYETGSTRKYLHGRTETIRTCSLESKAFVEAFDLPSTTDKMKYDLMVQATVAHRKYTQIASDGRGCDRHLLALKLLNMDHPVSSSSSEQKKAPLHGIFTDPIFTESQTFRLSTSGLQAGDQIMGTGFGAATQDGYGINYMAARTLIKFGMESKSNSTTLPTADFAAIIEKTLRDVGELCERMTRKDAPDNNKDATARL
ncbi:acyltransferase ChoActase/COT/CPT [Halteromyces radiatus]|uniref:acyltransferase ChoActase/COT/CPT n=1 Tax=Halteromyces radiatus TaxID=101107 RepID=UPI00221ECF62|nr:acyltransferase ChoActase/COT/CPT [Halteromyces radiatus]KAI8083080.1 acyltransferase ChoActase/COT/CPT [Halteromyces radiatus]